MMAETKKNPIRTRVAFVGGVFTLWLAIIGARAVYIQVVRGDALSRKASAQYEASVQATGRRGNIYDCKGREMAVSLDAVSICAYPGRISDVRATSAVLADTLRIDRKTLVQRLSDNRPFVWVERQVSPRESQAVGSLQLGGIDFREECKRFYPNRTLAAQLLGFTGIDGKGMEGLEFRYNPDLTGDDQQRTVLRDALGRGFGAEVPAAAPDPRGHDLVLTLDRTVQFIAEQALKEAVDTFSAASGMAVVMVPETGAILALAHYPFFNPNTYQTFDRWQWRNRAITDPFEPGSTLKIFTAAAAIEKGGLGPHSIFFCENGAYRIGSHTVHDTHAHGWLSLQHIVKVSSNIGAIKVVEAVGAEALFNTLQDFGFGERTGIDCPGETTGCLPPLGRWTAVDTGAISFGQGLSVSAVQLAAAVNAIANGGMRMRPYVVQAVMDEAGNHIRRFGPHPVKRSVSAKTAQAVTRILATVTTEGGTGASAALDEYTVAGKTGTAQKCDQRGTYAPGRYLASFVGFAPAEAPRVTIAVIIDEPEKEHYGGLVAGPAFRRIATEVLHYLDVPAARPFNHLTVSRGGKVRG